MIKINDNLKIYFPLKLKPRDQQIEAFNLIKESINTGKKNILLNLPTGSGKSYLALMFMNYYRNFINENANFDILTNSKILQDQYIKDFPHIKDYRGRANFYCDPYDTDCSKGHTTCKTAGPHCPDCPYEIAKKSWQGSEIGLTNFHLFNTLAVYVRSIFDGRDSHVLIVDEAHDFESVFSDFISVDLCAKSLKNYGFDLKEIEDYDNTIRKITKISQFIGFIENQFIQEIKDKIIWFDNAMKNSDKKMKSVYSNYVLHCESQILKFKYLIEEFKKRPDNWILDISKTNDKMYSGILIEAKVVWANDYIKEKVFDKYDHVIFMSGSILDKELFSYINGLETDISTYIELPSTFPINRHPIYYIKLGKMTWSQKNETFKEQLIYINKILNKNKNKKGIIHANSYEFVNLIKENCINNRLIFHTPENRDEMLQKHINSKEPTVIVSPSMISGVDLIDDLSRFQIIIKIPFPYLGSNMIKKRMETNKKFYPWKTVCDLTQTIGRSVRSPDDWAETFILDSSFSDILKQNSHLLPKHIIDAIKILKV